jgi:hypothetical protein
MSEMATSTVSYCLANTVLSGHSALHLHSAFHHAVHDALGYIPLMVAEEDDRCRMLIREHELGETTVDTMRRVSLDIRSHSTSKSKYTPFIYP